MGDRETPAKDAVACAADANATHATTRRDVERHDVDRNVDREIAALERELARARSERRWVDADELAIAIEERRSALAKVIPLDEQARRRAKR